MKQYTLEQIKIIMDSGDYYELKYESGDSDGIIDGERFIVRTEPQAIYYVDVGDLEGWTNETLADALKLPLAKIGAGVEIEQKIESIWLNDNLVDALDQDNYRLEIEYVVEKIVQG